MMQRDDFENRLGQGLKRWAQAGEPTLDLEALVKQRLGEGSEAPAEQNPAQTEQPSVLPVLGRKRRWTRWLGSVTAAAALVLAVGATFPAWSGGAADWPLVGPVVKEIIMKDAGLKWAYDMGFIQKTVAEVQEGDVTVRILGVVADRARTTVIYQITGWEDPNPNPTDGKPVQAGRWLSLSRPVSHPPSVFIAKVEGQGVGSWSQGAVETPVGLLGMASTRALRTDEAPIEVMVRIGEKPVYLNLDVQRTAEASREVPINLTREVDGLTIHLEAIIYTPAETMLRYQVEKEIFLGTVNLRRVGGLPYLEVDGKKIETSSTHGFGGETYIIFPEPVKGRARFVIPGDYQTVDSDAVFALEPGATQSIAGAEVRLVNFHRQDQMIECEWQWPSDQKLMGIAQFELIDASGRAVKLETGGEGIWESDGKEGRMIEGRIPAGFQPVAVRIGKAAVTVQGPWVFDLPR